MRSLELYAGIGGFAAAIEGAAAVVAAIEQSEVALSVYRANHAHPALARNISGLCADDLARFEAELWWMSPPCQSFTVRGARRDEDDPRAKSFLHLMSLIEAVRPRHLALENVPGFEGSRVHARFREVLARVGYAVRERVLCPTELGVPNRRRRFYLVASLDPLSPETVSSETPARRPLATYLDHPEDGAEVRRVADAALRDYAWAMHLVDPKEPDAEAATFTSAYGRSWVRSGAYLYGDDGVRLFSPREIARLLGFPASFVLPPELPRDKAYHLLGNSLSVVAVRAVLRALPTLAGAP